ncbi:MAG: DUF3786 domain-containing protein [Desulfobacteraceae bacterium]|nr:DUF3786 domain-containing protein [Desulfobacteraceae bacterium]
MAKFDNAMEVFKLLRKTNCRECNKQTCLAFAAAVFQGQAFLNDCPYIDDKIISKYGDKKNTFISKPDQAYQKRINLLKEEIAKIDLSTRTEKVGGSYGKNKLTIKILGKNFSVDSQGNISTDIHVNSWIAPVVYAHIINCAGLPLSGKWVSFRELENAMDWYRFFNHQCIKTLKEVADTYTNFFQDIIELFNGRQVNNHYDADISLIIHPLPKLPILICYNKPEDGLEPDLNLFFDSTADKNFYTEDIYTIGTGLAKMFKKLALTHG